MRASVSRAYQLGAIRRIHFVGIGGSGMSGIAEVLARRGYCVSGSDASASATTDRLRALGVRVMHGHDAAHVRDADVVVISTAVGPTNVERVAAEALQVPVVHRADMLAALMRPCLSVAVAGAHGKTTTTAMLAFALQEAGLDPTAVVGGTVPAFGSNARVGDGDVLVVEADESDASFLRLLPSIAVITNIDDDHLDQYGTLAGVVDAFAAFAARVPFYGLVIGCADDPRVAAVLARHAGRRVTYGTSAASDLHLESVRVDALASSATVCQRDAQGTVRELGRLTLNVPGVHNLLNALAAVAAGLELGVPFETLADALTRFRAADRRFDVRGEAHGVLVVDDYAHHPTEIAAVLRAAAPMQRRMVVAFQPHRYTRTAALGHGFGEALTGASAVFLTDIYAAGEAPLPGVTLETFAAQVSDAVGAHRVHVAPTLDALVAALAAFVRPGDLVLSLGAGSIAAVADALLARLTASSQTQEVRS